MANTPDDINMLFQRLKLNSTHTPGLPEVEFQNLFRKCRFCERIVPRTAQKYHSCIIDLTLDDEVAQHTIIDLTLDD